MLGTDEAVFNLILCKRSWAQLRATFDEYDKISDKTIEQAIRSEMSGWLMQTALSIGEFGLAFKNCMITTESCSKYSKYKTMLD